MHHAAESTVWDLVDQLADVKEDGLRHRGNVGSVWTLFAVTPTYIAAPEAASPSSR